MEDQALEMEAVTASGTEEVPTAAYFMLVLALIGIADAFCIYCAISAALTLLLFLAALWHVRTMSVAPHRQLSGGRWPASHRAVHQTR